MNTYKNNINIIHENRKYIHNRQKYIIFFKYIRIMYKS